MRFLFPFSLSPRDQIQGKLFRLAACFLFLFSLALTLSPAVRLHSWRVDLRWTHWAGFIVWLTGFSLLHRWTLRAFPERDPYILPTAALLTGWGLLTHWRLADPFGLRQTIWLAISLGVFFAGLRMSNLLVLLRRYKYVWLTGGLLLTAATIFFGIYPGGSGPRLWLGCCGIYLQPSEPLKLLLVVYLAAYLADQIPLGFSLGQVLPPTIVLLAAAVAILLTQRDLGTTSIFVLIYFAIIYLASGKKRLPLIAGPALLIAGLLGYRMFDVIRIRVDAWLNPWADPSGTSYQIVQSLISVASGRLIGRGPGLGSPGVVPVAHSDFIFTAIVEEMGLLGGAALLLLIGFLTCRSLIISLHAPNLYQRYLSAGLTVFFAIQSLLIVGGTIRLFPLTGVTLPFLSYGGSSLLTMYIALLLVFRVSTHTEEEPVALPHSTPYKIFAGGVLALLGVLILLAGFWSVFRADDLISRVDNPRRFVNDRFVQRGALLDRKNKTITQSSGEPGSYLREYLVPSLGLVTGYTHPLYGQAGLELALDPYLRGIQGSPASSVWLAELLYGQPPAGNQIRLSIDLDLQARADELLQGKTGALILLNAHSGEVLAMASHPGFDPNRLDEMFSQWKEDPQAPLLNRATQGVYPPGTALGPFLYADIINRGRLPELPSNLAQAFNGSAWDCAVKPSDIHAWGPVIRSGCPGSQSRLGEQFSPGQLLQLYRNLGFTSTPSSFPLPLTPADNPGSISDAPPAALGQGEISVSPLQMALAAAAISAGGSRPAPILAIAVETPHQGWVVLPSGKSGQELARPIADQVAHDLAEPNASIWDVTATAHRKDNAVSWYIGGTLPEWRSSPLAIAVVIEEKDPAFAREVGQALLSSVMNP